MLLRNIPSELAEEIVSYLPVADRGNLSSLFHLDPTVLQLPSRYQILLKYRWYLPKVSPININDLIEQSKGVAESLFDASRNGNLEVVTI